MCRQDEMDRKKLLGVICDMRLLARVKGCLNLLLFILKSCGLLPSALQH